MWEAVRLPRLSHVARKWSHLQSAGWNSGVTYIYYQQLFNVKV